MSWRKERYRIMSRVFGWFIYYNFGYMRDIMASFVVFLGENVSLNTCNWFTYVFVKT